MDFSQIKSWLLDFIFPKVCFGCGQEGVWLCGFCKESLRMVPPSCFSCRTLVPGLGRVPAGRTCEYCRRKTLIYAFYSPFLYGNPIIRDMIHGLKYQRAEEVSRDLGKLLASYARLFPMSVSLVCMPIPLHPARQRTRGFNQAAAIARVFCDEINIVPIFNCLVRKINTKPQAELSGQERAFNISGAFEIKNPERILGRDILLLDDVKTTGATMEEAARILKEAGARRVWAITVAH